MNIYKHLSLAEMTDDEVVYLIRDIIYFFYPNLNCFLIYYSMSILKMWIRCYGNVDSIKLFSWNSIKYYYIVVLTIKSDIICRLVQLYCGALVANYVKIIRSAYNGLTSFIQLLMKQNVNYFINYFKMNSIHLARCRCRNIINYNVFVTSFGFSNLLSSMSPIRWIFLYIIIMYTPIYSS